MKTRHSWAFIVLRLLLLAGGSGVASAQTDMLVHRHFAERLLQGAERGELLGKTVEAFMREEKVAFLQGGFDELRAACADTAAAMEVSLVDGKRYALSFYRDTVPTVVLSYPASYQLILGVTMVEAEDRLFDEVWRTPLPPVEESQVAAELLQQVGTSAVYVLTGSSYVIPELNSNRYYVQEEAGRFGLLYSEDLPLETLANLLTGADIEHQIVLDIKLVKYGYRTEDAQVPLRQWVAFCLAQGCTAYFGAISQDSVRVVCECVMHNEAMGYAHVMKLECSPSVLEARKGVVSARLNSYVPISNVKSLFKEDEYK